MRPISKLIVASLITILGLITIGAYMSPANKLSDWHTWVWWTLAYFSMLKPTFEYWLNKLD